MTRKLALVLGVANHRSIAWACVQSFLERNYDVIFTYQLKKSQSKMERLMGRVAAASKETHGRILGAVACNVEEPEAIPNLLQSAVVSQPQQPFDAVVHSLAYSNMEHPELSRATWDVYSQALHVSSYSLLELTRSLVDRNLIHDPSHKVSESEEDSPQQQQQSRPFTSITALSFLGAIRAVPNYQCMGPAKAALEATIRGLALEYGPTHGLQLNAVSAGPIATAAAKGGIRNFTSLQQQVNAAAPLRRSITASEVAHVVGWLSESSGVTGQTIYVDGGYSSIVPAVV